MTNYAFVNPPKMLPLARRIRWADALATVAVALLVAWAAALVCTYVFGTPVAGLVLPALAVNYKFIDQKGDLTSSSFQGLNATRGFWLPATVYVAGDTAQNGGFLFRCSVGGASAAGPGPSPNTLVDNAATWVLVGPCSGLCQQDAAQAHELGYQAIAKDDTYGVATFMYVKFTGITVAGDWVFFDNQGKTCSQIPAAAPGASKFNKVGISMGSQINGSFGWVMIQGVHDQANVTAGGTVGNLCAGVATAGRSTTVQTANFIFDGTVLRNAGVVGTGTVELYWPTCSGR